MTSCKSNVVPGLVTSNGSFNFAFLLKKVLPTLCFNCAGLERRKIVTFFNTTLFSCTSPCKVPAKALPWQTSLKGQICILLPLKFIKYLCKEGRVWVSPWWLSATVDICDHLMRTWILSDLAELVGSCPSHAMVSLTPADWCFPLGVARGACLSIGNAECVSFWQFYAVWLQKD